MKQHMVLKMEKQENAIKIYSIFFGNKLNLFLSDPKNLNIVIMIL